MLARRAVGQQPVVGDVVERRPSGPAQEVGGQAGRSATAPAASCRARRAARRTADWSSRSSAAGSRRAGQPLGRLEAATAGPAARRSPRPQARPASRRRDACRAAGRRAARRTARGGPGRAPAVARPGAGCVARRRPRLSSETTTRSVTARSGRRRRCRRACCSTVNRSRWPTWSRAPYVVPLAPRAGELTQQPRGVVGVARLEQRGSGHGADRLEVGSRAGRHDWERRAPSPRRRTGRRPRRCAAPEEHAGRAHRARTRRAGGRGTPRSRRGRACPRGPRARRAAHRRRRCSVAIPASARPDAAKARTATSVCFSRSRRCATRTTGRRSTARHAIGLGSDAAQHDGARPRRRGPRRTARPRSGRRPGACPEPRDRPGEAAGPARRGEVAGAHHRNAAQPRDRRATPPRPRSCAR